MIPGPDQIIACPKCKDLAKYATLISGNTFDARVWTDGKRVAPMLPEPPIVVMCIHCAECYWLADAERVGTLWPHQDEGQESNWAWAEAHEVKQPFEEVFYRAIDEGLATNEEQERSLRVLAWWRRNDAFRDVPEGQVQGDWTIPGKWRKNLEALVWLLVDDDDNERLMRSEVLRQLGEFGFAKQVLSSVKSPQTIKAVGRIQSLCDARDTCVRELLPNG
jgi:hypothetical protein